MTKVDNGGEKGRAIAARATFQAASALPWPKDCPNIPVHPSAAGQNLSAEFGNARGYFKAWSALAAELPGRVPRPKDSSLKEARALLEVIDAGLETFVAADPGFARARSARVQAAAALDAAVDQRRALAGVGPGDMLGGPWEDDDLRARKRGADQFRDRAVSLTQEASNAPRPLLFGRRKHEERITGLRTEAAAASESEAGLRTELLAACERRYQALGAELDRRISDERASLASCDASLDVSRRSREGAFAALRERERAAQGVLAEAKRADGALCVLLDAVRGEFATSLREAVDRAAEAKAAGPDGWRELLAEAAALLVSHDSALWSKRWLHDDVGDFGSTLMTFGRASDTSTWSTTVAVLAWLDVDEEARQAVATGQLAEGLSALIRSETTPPTPSTLARAMVPLAAAVGSARAASDPAREKALESELARLVGELRATSCGAALVARARAQAAALEYPASGVTPALPALTLSVVLGLFKSIGLDARQEDPGVDVWGHDRGTATHLCTLRAGPAGAWTLYAWREDLIYGNKWSGRHRESESLEQIVEHACEVLQELPAAARR